MKKQTNVTFRDLTKEQRSKLMSKIRPKDTKPELLVRKELYSRGLRYRIHSKKLPGKPDISVRKYNLVIEVRGCFWHGHNNCKNGHLPNSNYEYWSSKIRNNRERDRKNLAELKGLDYKVFELWECEIKNRALLIGSVSAIFDYLVQTQNFRIPLEIPYKV